MCAPGWQVTEGGPPFSTWLLAIYAIQGSSALRRQEGTLNWDDKAPLRSMIVTMIRSGNAEEDTS